MLKNKDSLIFDLDGTLWDAAESVAKAWEKGIAQLDFVDQQITAEDIRSVAGMQHDKIFEKFFPDLSKEQRQELMETCGKIELDYVRNHGGPLYDGMKEALDYLKKSYNLFIVSNCQDGYIQAFLDYHQLYSYFQDIECSGRTGNPKAENIKAVVSRNKLKAPVYVGDTQGDCDASYQSNTPFLYAKYGFGEVNRYDEILEQPLDLKRLF